MNDKPFLHLPGGLDHADVLLDTCRRLGLEIPATLAAASVRPEETLRGRLWFSIADVDRALAKFDIPPVRRLEFKAAMRHHSAIG